MGNQDLTQRHAFRRGKAIELDKDLHRIVYFCRGLSPSESSPFHGKHMLIHSLNAAVLAQDRCYFRLLMLQSNAERCLTGVILCVHLGAVFK
jgi:hypothetical protein